MRGDGKLSLPLHPCCCIAAGCFHSSNPLCSAWWFCGVSHVALKALPWQDLWLFHSPRHRRKTQFSMFLQNSDFMQETCYNTNWNISAFNNSGNIQPINLFPFGHLRTFPLITKLVKGAFSWRNILPSITDSLHLHYWSFSKWKEAPPIQLCQFCYDSDTLGDEGKIKYHWQDWGEGGIQICRC